MNSKATIYVMSPPYYATGGTELLHQLVYKLRANYHLNALIYYPGIDWKFEIPPTPKRFKKYIDDNWVDHVEDNSENILIIPETLTSSADEFKHLKKVIWWLSVDNYFKSLTGQDYQKEGTVSKLKDLIKKRLGLFPYKNLRLLFNASKIFLHLVQSEYSLQFLKGYNVTNVMVLSDFINLDLLLEDEKKIRLNQVLYNPAKGIHITKKIIEAAPKNIKWVPIVKMQPSEIAQLMGISKLYIDFGAHPGKDRIPREAVVNGCCLITNRMGAAKNNVDIPIPDSYKFDNQQIGDIVSKIEFCLQEYDVAIGDFESYRKKILNEEMVFEKDLKKLIDYFNF